MTLGDCYEAAGRYIMDHPSDGLLLVHGEVMGQGALEGIPFGHAWIEDGSNVIEVANGKHLILPKILYYAIGNIDEIGNVFKYTYADAARMMLKYEHWGPWDLKTER